MCWGLEPAQLPSALGDCGHRASEGYLSLTTPSLPAVSSWRTGICLVSVVVVPSSQSGHSGSQQVFVA